MRRWAAGGIILSSVTTKYRLGFVLHAGSLIVKRVQTPRDWGVGLKAAFDEVDRAREGGNLLVP